MTSEQATAGQTVAGILDRRDRARPERDGAACDGGRIAAWTAKATTDAAEEIDWWCVQTTFLLAASEPYDQCRALRPCCWDGWVGLTVGKLAVWPAH